MQEISRRNRIDLNTPAELAIRAAVDEVERAGADLRLTDAVVLLGEAREAVADFVDGIERRRLVTRGDGLEWIETPDARKETRCTACDGAGSFPDSPIWRVCEPCEGTGVVRSANARLGEQM